MLSGLETGRQLLMSSDPAASLRTRGIALSGPASLARLVREAPSIVSDLYHEEIAAGADVLCALTSETMPRVLGEIGMAFRAAALTGTAVELALDAAEVAPRPIAVAGVLGALGPRSASGVFPAGSSSIPPSMPAASERIAEEYAMHAARLAAAGCELIIARGVRADLNKPLARMSRRAANVSASTTQLTTWAMLDLEPNGFTPDGEALEEAAHSATEAGANAILFEMASPAVELPMLDRMSSRDAPLGLVLGDSDDNTETWAANAKAALDGGARILGGGHGVNAAHIAALRTLLRGGVKPSMWPRAL